jgi:uncharacterized protein (DUF1499 family)
MTYVILDREPALSRWATRIALFSFGVIIAALFLHRLFGMPTPVAFNLFVCALLGAGLSILCAVVASVQIWNGGRPGTARVLFAVCASLAILAAPALMMMAVREYPMLYDITTDAADPPQFTAVAQLRTPGSNPVTYDGAGAEEQRRAYPDIKPIVIQRPSDEAYALVLDAVKRLKMQIERDEAPDTDSGGEGSIEAVDRTLFMGFYDDFAIRVRGEGEERSRVDIRSASRFGMSDLGHNAERIRELMAEIHMRVESSTPAASDDGSDDRGKQKKLKRAKDADPKSVRRRKLRDREQ